MTYRPLTPDHKVDIERMAADPQRRTLADLLPDPEAFQGIAPAQPARPRTSSRAQLAGGLVAGLVVLLLGLYAAQRAPASPAAPAAPPAAATAAPGAPSVAPAAAAAPAAPPVAQSLPRAVVAWAAPGGAVLGPIEAGRPYTPTARLAFDWVRIDAQGSGLVWVRAAELEPAAALPDLATPTAPPPPPATAAPVIQVREVPVAPQPTQCATVSGGGTSIQRCGAAPIDQLEADARAAWRAQFGGNTAPIATMTPYRGQP